MEMSLFTWRFFSPLLMMCVSFGVAQEMDKNVPMGWAVYQRYGLDNTTGGHNGRVVTATSNGELSDYCQSREPLVIIAEGSFSGTFSMNSDKSLIGGGSGAKLNGGIKLGSNCILRNFEITGGTDAIQANGNKHHIWVDHCDLYDCGDGLFDITNESDLITCSWTRFSNHHKTMLINNGGENADEVDKLNVTLHHIFWDGSDTRNPRCGYGDVHILNNFYNGNPGYGVHMHWEVRVLLERNYFKNVGDGISQHKPGAGTTDELGMDWDGYAVLVDNVFDNSGQHVESVTEPQKIFNVDGVYMYDWIVDDVNEVPDIVSNGAGTGSQWSVISPIPTPGQGAVNISTNPTLKWTKVGSESSNTVYFGKAFPPQQVEAVDGYSYNPGNLDAGTVYYWKINDGKVWKFRTEGPTQGQPFVSITSPSNGTTFPASSDIVIEADAMDSDGSITSVEFFEGSRSLGTANTAPYFVAWNDVADGSYSITAHATDNHNNTSVSSRVQIVVGTGVTGLPAGYVPCSQEGEVCTFDGTANVAYGADGHFEFRENVSGSIDCSNSVFGDPISGASKACYVQLSTSAVKAEGNESCINPFNLNQVTGEVTIHLENDVSAASFVTVHNYQGKRVHREKFLGMTHKLNIEEFSCGVYVISVTGQNTNFSRKIFKN